VRGAAVRSPRSAIFGLSIVALLSGCVSLPAGPTVAVMPAPNKPFEVFQQDQGVCKEYAYQEVASGADRVNDRAVGTAFLTTILGAALGAAVGGGSGAAIGAASGAVVGNYGRNGLQWHYDTAYSQCMYAKGNQVPGYYYAPNAPPPPPPPRG
jgi:uncharacterized protein YcfJ